VVIKKLILLISVISLVLGVQFSVAAEKRLYARKAIGQVHEVRNEDRSAIIGGYRYHFGSTMTRDASEVRLLGGYTGSFADLQPGWKVKVVYADYGSGRYVVRLEQIPFSVDIHTREARAEYLN
jgi:hypothetical protein